MPIRTPHSRPALIATLATLPGLALAHTGTDAGAHHSFLDALLYALSDLSLPAMVVALGIWGAIFMASRNANKRRQQVRQSDTARDRS